ncbi:glycosyltransferase family 39 protein [Pseudonocardia sp. WMMC193]|uniref:ArnT family glycosyltransferase n=1 Tax=Pseudonocardia sp. WMMC193 TaxID=2911965 RepID=UPI001F276BA6|nr:glycosyltransferase family 39 protein [Pseudonocardia sp. WMMC193]MCF7553234.1 glycosyltransferase family 39 protein [Pseudonocardia sp. WMMC193]
MISPPASPERSRAGAAPFATAPVLFLGAAATLVLVLASRSPLFFDEQYFLAAGRLHLAWGYMDQPPLVPALAALFGSWLRVAAAVGGGLTVVLAGAIVRELGGGRSAQVLAAAATACSGVLLMSHWLATYSLDPLFWTAIVWLVARRLRTGDDRLLLAAGVVTGLSLNTKFLVPVLWVAILAGAPALLRVRAVWAGLGIAALMTVPTLVWQARHGWPYLEMAAVVRRESEAPLAFAFTGLALFGLVGLVLLVVGIVRGPWWLRIVVVLVPVAIVLAGGRAYYLLEIVPTAIALGAARFTGGRVRWVLAGAGLAATAAGLAVLLPLPGSPGLMAAGEGTMQPAADVVRQQWRGEPVVAQIYPLAAAIDLEGIPAYSGHRGYGYFAPPGDGSDDALWIGVDPMPQSFRDGFTTCTEIPADGLHLQRCTGRTAPWSALLTPVS